MLSLYFGSAQAIQATLLVSVFIVISSCAFLWREKITHWGWLIAFALALGLYICVAAATRDGYHLSVQYAIDGSVLPGLFTVESIQSIVNCILAAVIVICGVLSIFLKRRKARQALFFILSASAFLKILVIEISRIFLFLQAT
ncbi:MAG: hypothetical protein RR954_06145 [Christensenellaceae bacterium]